jgi:hypothetical protein
LKYVLEGWAMIGELAIGETPGEASIAGTEPAEPIGEIGEIGTG